MELPRYLTLDPNGRPILLGNSVPLDPRLSTPRICLREQLRFGNLPPCVSGIPSVAGYHHDWSGTPPDWNGDAGLSRINRGSGECYGVRKSALQS
jgi:hypothetical protein